MVEGISMEQIANLVCLSHYSFYSVHVYNKVDVHAHSLILFSQSKLCPEYYFPDENQE